MSKMANILSVSPTRVPSGGALGKVYQSAPVLLLPLIGLLMFLAVWNGVAKSIDTSLGQFPGPAQVWEQAGVLVDEHNAQREKADAFYERQAQRNAARVAQDPSYEPKVRDFTGAPTFIDQIWTSLYTVMVGFFIASIIAVPLGIVCGLSKSAYTAINPLIQLFKPVSPLAWLPLVTMVVSALYVSDDPAFSKSFVTSAFTVSLCCLWPTLINTAVGVSSIDSDLINVSKVLRLTPFSHLTKIVLPSSIPMIFTGLRLSLGIGWMVLIAAEMLAQNPGLGKFVWDEFQNGSSESLARIMVAVLTIGAIGFVLDRAMLSIQRFVSWDKTSVLR
ncbi:ABC transporter permease [Alteromonas australica]|uniref:Nitrate ABC transporter permease n=1 Tax=Alteromonas australica TaxID=589873 RepID=A0A358DXT8_9ALTE|nr:ABC transporter permease [Alteromonas australica]MAF72253.1 nitrate ABC transporter permease [Alteromonas sp.]MBU34804.1 nitrate ABC transporter permease [Alteromonas sp.]HAI71279.1 nitrate ABC transporter permease [Alteromonas australica]HBU51099.1 nitrate ABC transporter permease [Alteromonas australica]